MPRAYCFEGFRIDLVRRQLVDGRDETLPVSSRAYEVLVHLIENRARVVSKDDVMKAVWPNTVVEENNVNQAISMLRRVLGDQRAAPRFIATVAGRGYQFVAEVAVEADGRAEPIAAIRAASMPPRPVASGSASNVELDRHAQMRPVSRRLVLAGLASAVAGGAVWYLRPNHSSLLRRGPPVVAVLPFQPLVPEARNEPLELGMADTLINYLSSVPGVTVAPLSSVRRFVTLPHDPLAVGRELQADVVLESNIQFQPDRIRLTARLLDVNSGTALWAGRFDEPLNDYFLVQDILARQIVDALEVPLAGAVPNRLTRQPTKNMEAWQLYLKARYQFGTRSVPGIRNGIAFFEAALAADPEFALAASGLADAWVVLALFNVEATVAAIDRARRAAWLAVTLQPQLAEAQASLGHVSVQGDRDWKTGEDLYRKALALNPAYTTAVFWLGNNLSIQGRHDAALVLARQAQVMEPVSIIFAANVGMVQYYAQDFQGARRTLADIVAAAPGYPLARRYLARVMMADGSADDALMLLEGHEDEHAPGSLADLGRAYALTGSTDAAVREASRLRDLGGRGFAVGYDLALIHAALGDRNASLDALERAVTDGSQMIGFLNSEAQLRTIRDHPRFRAVSRSLRL